MKTKNTIVLSNNMKCLFNQDDVIIFNRTNRQWLKIPKECYDILLLCNNKYTVEELMEKLADDEDRNYMKKVLAALEKMALLGKTKPRQLHDVSFAISNRCNLLCKHCMVNADNCAANENFTTEQIKEAFDRIVAACPEVITVTGGEPLVRNDFLEIIAYLRKTFNGKIGLMTNATLINEKNVNTITESVNNISISLDGVNEQTVELIRGRGVYKKVLEAIKLLHTKGFYDISISMVLTADNEIYIDEFLDLCKKNQCEPVLRALSLSGQAGSNKDLLTKKQLQTPITKTDAIKQEARQETKNITNKFYTCSCDAGATTLTIESDGNIYPCNLFVEQQYCLGNIMDITDLKKLLQKDPKKFISDNLLEYEPDKIKECQNCNLSYFCWSCLHEIKELRDCGRFEEKCKVAKKTLSEIWEEL